MLLPNSNQRFILPKNETLLLESTADFSVIAQNEQKAFNNGSGTVGPFTDDEVIYINSTSATVYAKFKKQAEPKTTIRQCAIMGTSLVQHCENTNSSGKLGASSRSWFDWAAAYSGGALDMLTTFDNREFTGWEPSGSGSRYFNGLNFGVSGQGIKDIWARARQALSFREHYQCIIIDAGTNDMGTLSTSEILFLKATLSEYFAAYGIKVVMLTVLARGVGSWAAGGDERKKMNHINSELRESANLFSENVILHDWNEEWVDKGSQYGEPVAGYDADDIHFAPAGALPVGKGLWDRTLSKFVAKGSQPILSADDLYDATLNPKGSFYTNPLMRGTGGTAGTGVTGSVCDDFTAERTTGSAVTAVGSKVTDSDGAIAQRLVFTLTAGSAFEEFYLRASNPTNIAHTIDGDLVRPFAVVRFNNAPDTFNQIGLEVVDQSNSNFRSLNFQAHVEGGSELNYGGMDTEKLVLVGRPLRFSPGSTQARLRLLIGMTDGGSTGASLDVFALGFKRIDEPEIFTPETTLYINGY